MTVVMVGNFGRDEEGVFTYSVNTTTKEDMQFIIDAVIIAGGEFSETPKITYKAKTFHALLKFFVPEEELEKVAALA